MGTSLFYYSTVFPFAAHAASFMLLVVVLHVSRSLVTLGPSNRALAVLGLCLAAIFLVRPQQVLVTLFLLPMLVQVVWKRPAAEWLRGALLAGGLCLTALALQLGMSFSQFGKPTLSGYSVGGEGFNWLKPQLGLVLASESRGLLVYSPVVVLAGIGFILFAHSIPRYVWPQVWNAVAQVYLTAAWSSPEQGDSFGCRMLSDNASVVGFGLAALIHGAPVTWKWVVGGSTLAMVAWTFRLLARYIGLA
jgi:hypothetical protein